MREKAENKRGITGYFVLAGIILIVAAVVALLLFFLHGETKVSGEWSGVEKAEALVCNSSEHNYPFLAYDNAQNGATRVNVIFDDGNVKTISLNLTLYYNSKKEIIDSENLNRVAMSEEFINDGLGFDALGLKFSEFDGGLQMSLFSNGIDGTTSKYFMLDGIKDSSMAEMQRVYVGRGFECETNNQ